MSLSSVATHIGRDGARHPSLPPGHLGSQQQLAGLSLELVVRRNLWENLKQALRLVDSDVVVAVVIVHWKPPDKPPLGQGPSPSPAAQIQSDDC